MSVLSSQEALSSYKLAEVIGKGAFGSVYKALNWTTGETVAIKQIGLSNIPQSELKDIMVEIDLLKNLNHPNIVQYGGFVKTIDHLYIILEYCENGSLYSVTKKFGCFPESLVGLYVLQILSGLVYLHAEGVIHRDIKASNILLDKTGAVRLADFGVSTTVASTDLSVVGSPYWMAPEVVEQRGANSASDIWSLGALVIELLTGKPPYHTLDPLPALFRIVNDDCPPISETFSVGVKDFLLQCFQKDSNLRISAKKLLRHPWMLASKVQADKMKRNQLPKSEKAMDETVEKVQRWNEAIKAPPVEMRNASENRLRPSFELATALQAPTTSAISAKLENPIRLPLPQAVETSQDQDNWDEDFADGVSFSALAVRDSNPAIEEVANFKTLRPSNPSSPVVNRELVEDYSDFVDGGGELEAKLANYRDQRRIKKLSLQPNEISPPLSTIHMRGSSRTKIDTPPGSRRRMEDFVEQGEDYEADFGISIEIAHLSSKSWLKDGSDEEDPFSEFLEIEMEVESDELVQKRVALVKNESLLSELLSTVRCSEESEEVLADSTLQLLELLEDYPAIRSSFLDSYGLLILVDALRRLAIKSAAAVANILRLFNFMIGVDPIVLEKLSSIGACAEIFKFIGDEFSYSIRLESALFSSNLCRLNTAFFVAIGGINLLVSMLSSDYSSNLKPLIWLAVDGCERVLHQSPELSKPELCRLFLGAEIMENLTISLLEVCHDDSSEDAELVSSSQSKITLLLMTLSHSQKFPIKILSRLVKALESIQPEPLVDLLKTFKFITSFPDNLAKLQATEFVQVVVKILARQVDGKAATEIVLALFNFCQFSKERQELAALSGAIPPLLEIIESNSHLKQFAMPMILDFSQTSAKTRVLLLRFDGVKLYLSLLRDPFWAAQAFERIVAWFVIQNKVEQILLEPQSLDTILHLFTQSKSSAIDNLIPSLNKLFRFSKSLTKALSSPILIERIIDRLGKGKPTAQLGLLKLIKTILDARITHVDGLELAVTGLIRTESIMVRELAKEVLVELRGERERRGRMRKSGRAREGTREGSRTV